MNKNISVLTDKRLRELDINSSRKLELLESINSDLEFIKNNLRSMRIYCDRKSNVEIESMYNLLMENDIGEERNGS